MIHPMREETSSVEHCSFQQRQSCCGTVQHVATNKKSNGRTAGLITAQAERLQLARVRSSLSRLR